MKKTQLGIMLSMLEEDCKSKLIRADNTISQMQELIDDYSEDREEIVSERDTYRAMCVELMQMMRNLEVSANSADYCYARNGGNFAYSLAQLKADAEKARELFTKAEKLLGSDK